MPGRPKRSSVGPIGDGRDRRPSRVEGNDLTRSAVMQSPVQPTTREQARQVVAVICDYTADENLQRELAAMLLAKPRRTQIGQTSPLEWGVA